MKPEEIQEAIKKIEVFTGGMTAEPSNFWRHSSIHHIAVLLGVCRKTIYNLQENHGAFLHTIKRWEERRNALFLELKNKQGAWIFLAKNWLGMSDNQTIEHSGGIKAGGEIVIKVVHVSESTDGETKT